MMFLMTQLLFAANLPNPIVEVEKPNALKIAPISLLLLGRLGITYERADLFKKGISLEVNGGAQYYWMFKYMTDDKIKPNFYNFYLTAGPKIYYGEKSLQGFYVKPALFIHHQHFGIEGTNDFKINLWSSGLNLALGYQIIYEKFLQEFYLGLDLGYIIAGNFTENGTTHSNLSEYEESVKNQNFGASWYVVSGFLGRIKMGAEIGYRIGFRF